MSFTIAVNFKTFWNKSNKRCKIFMEKNHKISLKDIKKDLNRDF